MLEKKIQKIINDINDLSKDFSKEFLTEEMREEFLENIESAIINIEDCESNLEANKEYKKCLQSIDGDAGVL